MYRRQLLSVSASTFLRNVAAVGSGGGLHVEGVGALQLLGGVMDGNEAGSSGGAVGALRASVLLVQGTGFHGNRWGAVWVISWSVGQLAGCWLVDSYRARASTGIGGALPEWSVGRLGSW